MAKLTKRVVDAVEIRDKDHFIWDDELPGFGLRVFASGEVEMARPTRFERVTFAFGVF